MLQIGKFYYYFLLIYKYKHSVYRLIQDIEIYFPYVKLMSWLLNCKGKCPEPMVMVPLTEWKY